MTELPDFDTLLKLAKENPEELESLKQKLIQKVIEAAPTEDQRRRLRGLQFKIDAERVKAKTPMGACIKISEMMRESFSRLKDSIDSLQKINPVKKQQVEPAPPTSSIIEFKRKD